jgi:hypothetical protein
MKQSAGTETFNIVSDSRRTLLMETLNNGTAAAGDSATTNPSGPVSATPAIEMNTAPSTEAEGFKEWVRQDLAAGKMTREQADTALREIDGTSLAEMAKDNRNDAQRFHDSQWPPSAPEGYIFPRYDDPENITKEMTAFDKTARNWLSTGLFPKEEGSFVAREVNRVAEQIDGFTDAQHELFQRSEMNKLTCIWREDTAKNIATAQAFIKELDAKSGGKIIPFLNASGTGDSSALVIQIYNQALRLSQRNGVKL